MNVGFATLQVIPSMQGVQAALQGQMSGPSQAAGASAGTVFGGGFGGALKGGLLAAGAAVAVGGLLASVGSRFDEAFDHIRTETGATGEELEGLKDVFRDVVGDVPNSFEEASQAVAGLEQRLHLTGKPLEDLSEQVLHLTNLTDEDLGQTIESTTRLFGDWGVATEDQTRVLDELFRASQATGVGVNDLAQQVVQFGSPLRQMGFGLEEGLALLGKFEAEGVNVSTVMSGMRQAVANFAADGVDPMRGFRDVLAQVADGTFTMNDAIEIFGRRAAPDMFAALRDGRFDVQDLVGEIRNGRDTIAGAAEDTYDWRESLSRLGNRLSVLVEPAAVAVFDAFGDLVDVGLDLLKTYDEEGLGGVLKDLKDRFEDLEGPAKFITGAVAALAVVFAAVKVAGLIAGLGALVAAAAPVVGILLVVGLVVGAAVLAWYLLKDSVAAAWRALMRFREALTIENFQKWVKTIRDAVGGAFRWLAQRTQGAREAVGDALAAVGRAFARLGEATRRGREVIGNALSAVVRFFRELPGKVLGAIARLPGMLMNAGRAAIRGLRDGMLAAWSALIDWVRGIPGRIIGAIGDLGSTLYDAGHAIIDGFLEGLKDAFGAVTDFVGGIAGTIAGLKGPLDYDRRLLVPAGHAIMGGLERGLRKGWAGPARFLRGITSELAATEFTVGGNSSALNGRVRSTQSYAARVVIDVTGADQELVRMVRKMVRVQGGGNVQTALGSR